MQEAPVDIVQLIGTSRSVPPTLDGVVVAEEKDALYDPKKRMLFAGLLVGAMFLVAKAQEKKWV